MVTPGSTVLTDGWKGYNRLSKCGYTHKKVIASLLKRWILGTHQGSVSEEHLQSYLEEYTFRFNRRTSRSRGLVFRRLLEQLVTTGPVTEADIAHGYYR